jgi:hypothetical protein
MGKTVRTQKPKTHAKKSPKAHRDQRVLESNEHVQQSIPQELLELVTPKNSKKNKQKKQPAPVAENLSSDDEQSDINSDEDRELEAYLDMQDEAGTQQDVVVKVYQNKTEALKLRLEDIAVAAQWIDTQVLPSNSGRDCPN